MTATVNDEGFGYTHGDTIKIIHPTDPSHDPANRASLTLNRDKFTVIMRDLINTKLTLKYENIDQFAFVEGTNLGDEPNGTQSVSDIVFLKSRTDGTDNVASLAIADGGSGYPNGGGGESVSLPLQPADREQGWELALAPSGAGVINSCKPPPAGTQGAGYRNGDIVNVVPNGGVNNATLTVTTTRHSQVADHNNHRRSGYGARSLKCRNRNWLPEICWKRHLVTEQR